MAKPYTESWETSADGLTWTFHIRKGVKFHDGQDCTAEDVKFTMDQMLNPKVDSARGRQFLMITETRVVDPLTVQFQLSSPWAALPTILAGRWAVAPKHILEKLDLATDTTFDKKPIGIGPYVLSEWVAGDHLVLTANKDYFLGAPKIDTVIFKVLPDASVQIAQLKTGEVDAIPFFSDASIPAVKGQPGLTVDQGWGSIFYAVHLNMNRSNLFGDKRVRQALSYAIDRQAIINNVLDGNGTMATGPIIPQIAWAFDANVAKYPFDPGKAKALLQEAGWTQGADGIWSKDGVNLTFPLVGFQGNSTVQRVATLVQQYWADIGVKTDLQIPEFSTFVTNVRDNRSADGFSSFVSYMTPDPEPDCSYAYFHSSNAERGSNFTAYKNPEVDKWLDIGRRETDRAKRKEAYDKVQEILAEDQTRLFLFYPPTNLARRQNVSSLSVVDTYYYLENAYFV